MDSVKVTSHFVELLNVAVLLLVSCCLRVEMTDFYLFLFVQEVAVQLFTLCLRILTFFIRQDKLKGKRFVVKIEDYVPENLL